jgi:hypothetical protein
LDARLQRTIEITIIGGAAIGLVYDGAHTTTDIDLTPTSDEAFWTAVRDVTATLEHPVPIAPVSIYEAPYDWEGRREAMSVPGVTKLVIRVPEAHDLAIMKLARGATHDLQAIEDIHRSRPLKLEILVERYYDTLTQKTGSAADFRLSLLAIVDRLFGPEEAREVERRLDEKKPPPLGTV